MCWALVWLLRVIIFQGLCIKQMHELEPYYNWRSLYIASEDPNSPFYGQQYSEFEYSNAIYDYFIHPQWDQFESNTLYLKILYVSYDLQYCVIELIGEWNDAIYSDIMSLYRNVIEQLLENDIKYFIMIGENVLNFHFDTTDYYEEWVDNIGEGWIIGINFRGHVIKEFEKANLDYYIALGGKFDDFSWRSMTPDQLFNKLNALVTKRLEP
jgi:hypothetical protein